MTFDFDDPMENQVAVRILRFPVRTQFPCLQLFGYTNETALEYFDDHGRGVVATALGYRGHHHCSSGGLILDSLS